MKMRESRGVLRTMWLQGTLLALAVLVWWWLQQRGRLESTARPVMRRRDTEMRPTRTTGQTGVRSAADWPAETSFPDVEAGDGGPIEVKEREASAGVAEGAGAIPELEVPVEGPAPEAEGQGLETPGGDDLEIIEGIGPKINTILHEAGIRTFKQLSETNVETLEQVLREVGLRLANPSTWPEQARLAADGEWSKLEALQGTLKAGRKG